MEIGEERESHGHAKREIVHEQRQLVNIILSRLRSLKKHHSSPTKSIKFIGSFSSPDLEKDPPLA